MENTTVEKSEEELQREIDELYRQRRQIIERLRDPRGLRRGLPSAVSRRNYSANGFLPGFVRSAGSNDVGDQPLSKRRLLSTIVKVEDEAADLAGANGDVKKPTSVAESFEGSLKMEHDGKEVFNFQNSGWPRRDPNQRVGWKESEGPINEHVPRVLPKNDDPSLVSRNRRMLGQLLGTLEKFRKEDVQLSETDAYIQRSNALRIAEQRSREESERLRQKEREQIAKKRRRDLILSARVAAKTDEKKLELLFLRWTEHHRKLSNFIRTKAKPPIYYMPVGGLYEKELLVDNCGEQILMEWKAGRREELWEYQKGIAELYLANIDKDMERWQNARTRRGGGGGSDANLLQERMDMELETHRLEHGPKKRNVLGGRDTGDEEDELGEINVGDEDLIFDVDDVVLADEASKPYDDPLQVGP